MRRPTSGPNSARPLDFSDRPDLEKVQARFWSKVDRSAGANACWRWTGARRDRHAYGQFCLGPTRRSGTVLAHRAAYALSVAPLPASAALLHSCDHPWCVNTAHLSVGTHSQNVRDAWARGRRPRFQSQSELSFDAILQAKRLQDAGVPAKEIARRLDLSKQDVLTVLRVLRCLGIERPWDLPQANEISPRSKCG